jgi:membrane dipeptidase
MTVINLQGSLTNPNIALEIAKSGDLTKLPPPGPARVDARAICDAKLSGLNAVCVTVGHVVGPQEPYGMTVAEITVWNEFAENNQQDFKIVRSISDIQTCRDNERIGIILGFQNTEMLKENLGNIGHFVDAGVRIVQLTYNLDNSLGSGCLAALDKGLTSFGHKVVHELNRCGVLVDLSHANSRTLRDAIAASQKPIAVTHSGCRSLSDNSRNTSDEDIRCLSDAGGVLGIYAMPFLRPSGQPYLENYIQHIERAISVAGEDHVALGTDGAITAIDDMSNYMHFLEEAASSRRAAGVAARGEEQARALFLPDMTGPQQFQILASALGKRGHSAKRIEKIMGENWLRLLAECWQTNNQAH